MTSAVHNEVCRKGVPVQRAQTHTATMLGPASPVPDPNNPSAYLHRDLSRLPSRGHHGTYVQSVHMTGPRLHDFRRNKIRCSHYVWRELTWHYKPINIDYASMPS